MLIPMLLLSSLNGTPQIDALHYFQGTWSCEGHFEPSMKPISSTMRFGGGEVSMAMQKHHDDHAPSNYHAIEIWGLAAEAGVYRATITDSYSGIRWFTSPGWVKDQWTWDKVLAAGERQEAFVYTRLTDREMRVDWQVVRGGALSTGDTLTCKKIDQG
jgi:hypothetical protein